MKLKTIPVHGSDGGDHLLGIQVTDDHVKLSLPDFTLEIPNFNTWSMAATIMHTRSLHTPDDTYRMSRWAANRLARLLRRWYLPRHGLMRDNQGFTWLILGDIHSDGRGECYSNPPTPSCIRRTWLAERVPTKPDDSFHRRISAEGQQQRRDEAVFLRECRAQGLGVTARQIVRGEEGPLPF